MSSSVAAAATRRRVDDNSATVGEEGIVFQESNDYDEEKIISLAKVQMNTSLYPMVWA
jgi:hypothetical protein